uniref:bacterio-opsin activator n=1 Tax=Paenibacillus terrae TaxID=159743 RepID=UPI0011A6C833|nr:bacterio-opsin activator [Paenibacillus terrae]
MDQGPVSRSSIAPHRHVIGFANEMKGLEEWLANPEAGTQLFSVTGIGGIGKTTLLMEMARRTRDSSVLTLWLDGRGELATSHNFLQSLEMGLESELGRRRHADVPLLPYIVSELSRQRTILLIDNGEELDRMEGWLLSSFLPRLDTASVLFVMASRKELPVTWLTNPYWGERTRTFPLRLFTREEVHEYLSDSGLEADIQMDIARKADGYPLLLALTVDWFRARRGPHRSSRDIPAILSAELLREVSAPELHQALVVLSLLPEADHATLNHFVERELDESEFNALSTLSFMQATSRGFALHHVVSRLLREDYAEHSPLKFQELRKRVFDFLAERFHCVNKRQQMRDAAHVLELYREFLPAAHAYANFSSHFRPGEFRLYGPEDLPYLHRYLEASVLDWQNELVWMEDYHELLDRIAEHCPEGICILRDDGGIPLAFCAGVWLHASTKSLLERYAPGLIPILGHGEDGRHEQAPETPDSICILLAAVDVDRPMYRPEELGALLMQQWLVRITSGLRGIIVTADPHLNSLFPMFGFNQVKHAGPSALTKWELDFRQSTFSEWIHRVIRQTGPVAAERELPLKQKGTDAGLNASELKQALLHLTEADVLDQLPVAGRLNKSGAEIKAIILGILTAEDPPYPLTPLETQMLRDIYLHQDRNRNQLADSYYMSRTTFYRCSQAALRHLAAVLRNAIG